VNDPWAFGWTQVFTLVGFAITITIAIGGFKTFGRWRREKLEEERISVALEAAALAFETKYIFESIRSPMAFSYEWQDLPKEGFKDENERSSRGAFYAALKRVRDNKEFFERAFKLQPKCMALLGKECEDIFILMHRARREIEVASQMLTWRADKLKPDMYEQLERDIWDSGGFEPEKDRVGKKLREFREKMEALCQPVINAGYRRGVSLAWFKRATPRDTPPVKRWETVKNG
jgi:hypothetical protein